MMCPTDLKEEQGPALAEPLLLKVAQLYHIGQEQSKSDQSTSLDAPDVPYCFLATLQHLKKEAGVVSYQKLNPENVLAAQVDIMPPIQRSVDEVFDGVKVRMAENTAVDLLEDAKSQSIDISLAEAPQAERHVCSVLSLALRLPPFDCHNLNGMSYLRIRVPTTQEQNILFFRDKSLIIVPLMDRRK